jgi:hypothetical protein
MEHGRCWLQRAATLAIPGLAVGTYGMPAHYQRGRTHGVDELTDCISIRRVEIHFASRLVLISKSRADMRLGPGPVKPGTVLLSVCTGLIGMSRDVS